MIYLKCIFNNCDKTVLNVEHLQAHSIKNHHKFIHLDDLDDLVKHGDMKYSDKPPIQDKPRKRIIITHCKRGHKLTPENSYRTVKGRTCRKCHIYRSKLRRIGR